MGTRAPDGVVEREPIELGVGTADEQEPTGPRADDGPDHGDFELFYRAAYPTVVRLAYSLCGSMAVAEELAQEAFVAAHRRWPRLARYDRPDLWVRRVVINRSISHRRRQRSERSALERAARTPETDRTTPAFDDEVLRALRTLSPRQAEVLALVYLDDLPIAEVADILRLGTETVKTHLKRGRAALAQRLDGDGHEPDRQHDEATEGGR